MKIVSTVLKVLAALAAVAGVVYLLATYGDKLVAWAKKMLGCAGCEGCECCEDGECAPPAEDAWRIANRSSGS